MCAKETVSLNSDRVQQVKAKRGKLDDGVRRRYYQSMRKIKQRERITTQFIQIFLILKK
jgi:hypothetical protein